jgi:hypothetical protein
METQTEDLNINEEFYDEYIEIKRETTWIIDNDLEEYIAKRPYSNSFNATSPTKSKRKPNDGNDNVSSYLSFRDFKKPKITIPEYC